jgi:hypothetical protein
MKRRYYLAIIAMLLCVAVGTVYLRWGIREFVPMEPQPLYSFQISTLDTGLQLPVFSTSPGSTQQLNLTLASLNSSKPAISVPIDNITLIGYNSTIGPDRYINWQIQYFNKSLTQQTVFNYSSSVNPVVLQSNIPSSTVLTIQWASDAPAGRYMLDVNLGRYSFVSSPEEFKQSYGEEFRLCIIVNPTAT